MASMACIKSAFSVVPLNAKKALKVKYVRMNVSCFNAKQNVRGMVKNFSNTFVVLFRSLSSNSIKVRGVFGESHLKEWWSKVHLTMIKLLIAKVLIYFNTRCSINTSIKRKIREEKNLVPNDVNSITNGEIRRMNTEFKLLHTDVEMVNYGKHRIRQILEKNLLVKDKEETKKETPTIVADKKILVVTKDIDLINKFSVVCVSFLVKVKNQEEFDMFQEKISSEIYMLIASLQKISLA
ncbi:hypothetical protein MKW94_026925 [Papaver nudicaule]|uniref:Uncharacterized protein n=1 Tax=Papaver nudicaule TaxID=74823 RepID=A0AA41VDG5_PAPNU|nr:hypothetical protein [Papaver nudicaule]